MGNSSAVNFKLTSGEWAPKGLGKDWGKVRGDSNLWFKQNPNLAQCG